MPYQNQGVDETLKMVQARRAAMSGSPQYSGETFENLIKEYRQQNSGAKYTDALHHIIRTNPAAHADYLRRMNPGREVGR